MTIRSPPNKQSAGLPAAYKLRLYVSGATQVSMRAVVNARKVCEQYLKGDYQLEILNISDHVVQATEDQIIAAPTLIKLAPLPVRRFIGDMSNVDSLVHGLGFARSPDM